MKVDALLMTADLADMGRQAAEFEAMGYDGLFTAEIQNDSFLPLVLAAEHTSRLQLGTGIAVAPSRSPLHLAHVGQDMQRYSKGRFVLGLGSQVRAHIENRYSGVWSHPAERMRELILAIQAIWRCWNEGEELDFRGRFYRHRGSER